MVAQSTVPLRRPVNEDVHDVVVPEVHDSKGWIRDGVVVRGCIMPGVNRVSGEPSLL